MTRLDQARRTWSCAGPSCRPSIIPSRLVLAAPDCRTVRGLPLIDRLTDRAIGSFGRLRQIIFRIPCQIIFKKTGVYDDLSENAKQVATAHYTVRSKAA
jgi:hypothetical protein